MEEVNLPEGRISPEAQRYCEWTNSTSTSNSATCWRQAFDVPSTAASLATVVITARFSEVGALNWLVLLPFPVVVYVKDDRGEVRQGFRARLGSLGPKPRPAIPANQSVTWADVWAYADELVDHYGQAWKAHVQDDADSAPLTEADVRAAFPRRILDLLGARLTILIHANVGDESLSIADYAHRYRTIAETRRGTKQSRYVVFAHAHHESWHSMRLDDQLRCLCLSHDRRYITLTSPSRAYFLTVQDLPPLQKDACDQPFGVEDADEPADAPAGVRPSAVPLNLLRFRLDGEVQRAASAINVARAFALLLPGEIPPRRIVRDCCSSFIVSRAALLSRPASTYLDMRHRLATQPPAVQRSACRRGHSNSSSGTDGNDRLRIEELSMYAERLWRFIFRPSTGDVLRDVAVVGCSPRRQAGGFSPALELSVEGLKRRAEIATIDAGGDGTATFPPDQLAGSGCQWADPANRFHN